MDEKNEANHNRKKRHNVRGEKASSKSWNNLYI